MPKSRPYPHYPPVKVKTPPISARYVLYRLENANGKNMQDLLDCLRLTTDFISQSKNQIKQLNAEIEAGPRESTSSLAQSTDVAATPRATRSQKSAALPTPPLSSPPAKPATPASPSIKPGKRKRTDELEIDMNATYLAPKGAKRHRKPPAHRATDNAGINVTGPVSSASAAKKQLGKIAATRKHGRSNGNEVPAKRRKRI